MKLKVLLNTKVIHIDTITALKKDYELTYTDDSSVNVIMDDNYIQLKDYPEYKIEYRHYIESAEPIDISFILSTIKDTYLELSSITF